jgi:hypothetical protein
MKTKQLKIKYVEKLREYNCKDGSKNLSVTDTKGNAYRILGAKMSGLEVSKDLKKVTMTLECEAAFKK